MFETKGNGVLVTEEKLVSSFVRLHLGVNGGRVELIPSEEEKVVLEADENLMNCFEIVNAGQTLYVLTEGKFRRPAFSHLLVKVYLRQMYKLYHAGAGTVVCNAPITSTELVEIKQMGSGQLDLAFHTPAIKLVATGEGSIRLSGSCRTLEIRNTGEGDVDALEMKAEDVTVRNTGEGDLKLYAFGTIDIRNLGEGKIHYAGPGVLKKVVHHGEGEVRHIGTGSN